MYEQAEETFWDQKECPFCFVAGCEEQWLFWKGDKRFWDCMRTCPHAAYVKTSLDCELEGQIVWRAYKDFFND